MLFQRFLGDRSASVLPLFALAAIPLLGMIGASVDYSRAAAAQTSLQAAADTTSLAMAKLAPTLTADQLQSKGTTYFKAVFTRSDAATPSVTLTATMTGSTKVVVSATSSVNTMIMGVMGFKQLPIFATSTSTWGMTRLRVALVLDNTGSMTQGSPTSKIAALKTASHNLLSQLQTAATNNGDIYVSIIPFTKDVNVDPSNYTQSWIDWTAWNAANSTCIGASGNNANKCAQNGGTWTPKSHSTWNGCVTDRDQNWDTLNTAPPTGALYPAEQYSVCPVSLIAQTYDWTSLNNKIDAMVAAGNTNQPIGLVWGWQSLTPGSPLNAPAKDPNYKYDDVIVILSDGLNTEDRWSTTQSVIDARQQILCDNIKNAGVTIYAVQVDTDSEPTSAVLQYCAGDKAGGGDPSKFFLLTSPDQIVSTFQQIGTALSKLRISS